MAPPGAGRARSPHLPRPTPAAWRLLLVTLGLFGAAVNTGNNLVYLMFSLLAALLPVSALLGALNLRGLRGAVELPGAPRVGAPWSVGVLLHLDRTWPAARSIAVALPLEDADLECALVERIGAGEHTRLALAGRSRRRGPHPIAGVRLTSTFPLGFLRHERLIAAPAELLVLPAAGRATALAAGGSSRAGLGPPSAQIAGTEYAGLRRGGDEEDARNVDWKVTARRGVTIVRETAGESRREERLEIATRCTGVPAAARRRFEERVTRLAGRAEQALGRGDTVHLVVDHAAAGSYSGPRGRLPLLRRLARLVPSAVNGVPLPQEPLAPGVPPRRGTPGRRSGAAAHALRGSALACLAIGALALFVAGGCGALVLLLLLGSIAATTLSERCVTRVGSLGRRIWQGAALVGLAAYLADVLVLRRDLLAASLWLTVFVTLYCLFNARNVVDDRRLMLVSFLHVVLAAALTTEVAIALPLLAWILATAHGLVAATAVETPAARAVAPGARAGRLRWALPAAATAAATIVAALSIYVAVPHFGTGAFRPQVFRAGRMTGFSESATLGDIGRIKLDRSKVLEVEVAGARPPESELRWRGLALNEFDGRTWSRGHAPGTRITADARGHFELPGGPAPRAALHQAIRLEPGPGAVLFAAARPAEVASRDFRRLSDDGFGNLELPQLPHRRLTYSVVSEPTRRDAGLRAAALNDPLEIRAENLRLPDLDPRIHALAREITGAAPTRYDAALAIERWLAERLPYSLAVEDRGAADPLARFLFGGMPAHCEYFATAMVVLARSADIPARFVAGYLRGEKSRFAERYVVRQSDAHAWVEVYFPGAGWVPFDPTPPAGQAVLSGGSWELVRHLAASVTRLWDDHLVGLDLDDQTRGLLALSAAADRLNAALRHGSSTVAAWQPWRFVAIGAGLALAFHAARRWRATGGARRGAPASLPAFYATALRLVARRGLSRAPAETPAEFARRAAAELPPRSAERLGDLTRLYYQVRFDGVTAERSAARIARALLGDLRATLGRGRSV